MEWTISFLPDKRIAIIETRGVADEPGSIEMAKNISKTMAKYLTTRCLIDHSALSAVASSTIGIYHRPTGFINIGIPFRVKIAEVVLPAHKKHFAFLETVCRNRGFNFCIFDERESALQWLAK